MEILESFIKELKNHYRRLYDTLKPKPYIIYNNNHCVNNIFIDGGIELMTGFYKGKEQWNKLFSYQNLVKDEYFKKNRMIIEGKPGYGKTILMLQLLYDWCKSAPTLVNENIVIYLHLRDLDKYDTIYSAIKKIILPIDTDVTENDIKEIFNKMKSVLILLDGFDEYRYQKSKKTEIYYIMTKNILQKHNVMIASRPYYVPSEIASHFTRIRLTGFDEDMCKNYIENVVIGKNKKCTNTVMKKINKARIINDLSQIPLLFVTFAHLSYEKTNIVSFNYETGLFRFAMVSFYRHIENKIKYTRENQIILENRDFHKIALEALSEKNYKMVLDYEYLRNKLGNEFYDYCISIGILIEEEFLDITDTSCLEYKREVRFIHELFCQWYAAHYIIEQLADKEIDSIHDILQKLDNADVQYMYGFVCGLDKNAAKKIIDYLNNDIKNKEITNLCIEELKNNNLDS